MTPFQQRVVEEVAALDEKLDKLVPFIDTNGIFDTLPKDEQTRMWRQRIYMMEYSRVLHERIAKFEEA